MTIDLSPMQKLLCRRSKQICGVVCIGLAIMSIVIFALHGPRTCSDATGYIMGAVSIRHYHEFKWFVSDELLLENGFQCEFRCPKNMDDLAEYKRDKRQGYQKHWAPAYSFLAAALSQFFHIRVCQSFMLMHAISILSLFWIWKLFSPAGRIPHASLFLASILYTHFLWLISFVTFSEVVFMPVSMLSLLLLIRHTEHENYLSFWEALVLCSVLPVIRYIGGFQIIASAMIIILNRSQTSRKRIRDALLFIVFSCIPFLLWQIRNFMLTGSIRGEQISHPDILSRIIELLLLPGSLLFPVPPEIQGMVPHSLSILRVLVAWGSIVLFCVHINLKNQLDRTTKGLVIYSLTYLGCILLTTFITGEPYPFNYRIMLPFVMPIALAAIRLVSFPANNAHCLSTSIRLYACNLILGISAAWNASYCFAFLIKQFLCFLKNM